MCKHRANILHLIKAEIMSSICTHGHERGLKVRAHFHLLFKYQLQGRGVDGIRCTFEQCIAEEALSARATQSRQDLEGL